MEVIKKCTFITSYFINDSVEDAFSCLEFSRRYIQNLCFLFFFFTCLCSNTRTTSSSNSIPNLKLNQETRVHCSNALKHRKHAHGKWFTSVELLFVAPETYSWKGVLTRSPATSAMQDSTVYRQYLKEIS
jgi:hypothetical protein